jgi:hypothetical protein
VQQKKEALNEKDTDIITNPRRPRAVRTAHWKAWNIGRVHASLFRDLALVRLGSYGDPDRALSKEHRKNEKQEATIAELKSEIATLSARVKEQASQIQKVSAQFELSKAAPQTVLNNR